jgi:hypothetical protein
MTPTSSERSHSLPKSIRSPPSTRAGGNAEGKPGQRSEAGMALECSVRCRRSLLPKIGHGLPGENEPSVKARFARSRRVGLKHEVFNRREAVVISHSMGWHGHRYWFGAYGSLHGLPGENQSGLKARFARSRRVGLRHEVFNR